MFAFNAKFWNNATERIEYNPSSGAKSIKFTKDISTSPGGKRGKPKNYLSNLSKNIIIFMLP